jgi:hypothetical protein
METRYTVIIERINEGPHDDPVLTLEEMTAIKIYEDGTLTVRGIGTGWGASAGLWSEVRIIRKTIMGGDIRHEQYSGSTGTGAGYRCAP